MKKRTLFASFGLVFLGLMFVAFGHFRIRGETNSPLISVVIPVYNTEEYLPKCLDSLINQTYTSLEIICVNDGSKDNSLKILNEYQKKDNRIKVIDKPNGGVSSARNMGIDNATGKFLSFIDSDDYVESNIYKICIENLNKNKDCDILTFGYINEPVAKPRNIKCGKFYASEYLNLDYPVGYAWNSIYNMKVVKDEKIRFDESVSIAEDNLFIHMFLLKSNKIMIIDDKLYHYVDRGPGRYTREQSIISAINRGKALINFCIDNKIKNRYVWGFDYAVDLMYEKLMLITDENEKRERFSEAALIIDKEEIRDNMYKFSKKTQEKINEINNYRA